MIQLASCILSKGKVHIYKGRTIKAIIFKRRPTDKYKEGTVEDPFQKTDEKGPQLT